MQNATLEAQELVTVKIRKDAWKAAKIAAAEDETSLSDVASTAIDEYLERRQKARQRWEKPSLRR